jgi:CBS domain-containing protein
MASLKSSDAFSLLRTTPLELLMTSKQELVLVHENDHLGDVLSQLANHQILSAPLVDQEGKSDRSIDMLDIVAYASQKFDFEHDTSFRPDETQVVEFLKKDVKHLADMSRRNPWLRIDKKKSVKKALLFLSHPHCHRVWILEKGTPVGVISQLDLLKFLLEHKELFQDVLKESVQTLFPESRSPFVVSEQNPLIDALKHIYMARVSGVAVVDQDRKLVGNVSATDLQFITLSDPKAIVLELQSPVGEFFKTKEKSQVFGRGDRPHPFEPVTIRLQDKIEDVAHKLLTNKIHRLYVIDEERRPLQVLTLTDILGQFTLF